MSLCTLEQVKIYLRQAETDPSALTADDLLLDFLILRISDRIEKICGDRKFEAQDYVETYDGIQIYETGELNLDNYPINSVAYIKVGGTTIPSADYYLYNAEGYVKLYDKISLDTLWLTGSTGSLGRQNIEISYNAGYEEIPYDLNLIAIEMVISAYNASTKDSNVVSETLGDYSYTLANAVEVNSTIDLRLNRWRRLDG